LLVFITKRLVAAMFQLFVAATATFLMLQLVPGDPVWVMLGDQASAERVEALRHQLGLDRPALVRYQEWMLSAARLDLGNSLVSGRPVLPEVLNRLPRTLELSIGALLLAIIIGIPLGVLSAVRRGTWLDMFLSVFAVISFSLPVFVVGVLMVLIFSIQLGWLPSFGFVEFSRDPVRHILQALMPAAAIAIGITAITMRMTRSATLEVLGQDYVRTAHSKGLTYTTILNRHVVRNSFIPIITVLGYYFGHTFGGSILTEKVFNWPGLSSLLIDSIQRRDYPMVQGSVLIIVSLFLLINLLVDLLYGLLDPRIRYD
jgi:peptide/nickel transport system permease protein